MLPVVDTPAIQYVVEEAVSAGLRDVLMITGRGKGSIENHFDRNQELEDVLEAKGDEEGLALIRASSELADMYYVRQGAAQGTRPRRAVRRRARRRRAVRGPAGR